MMEDRLRLIPLTVLMQVIQKATQRSRRRARTAQPQFAPTHLVPLSPQRGIVPMQDEQGQQQEKQPQQEQQLPVQPPTVTIINEAGSNPYFDLRTQTDKAPPNPPQPVTIYIRNAIVTMYLNSTGRLWHYHVPPPTPLPPPWYWFAVPPPPPAKKGVWPVSTASFVIILICSIIAGVLFGLVL
jgi:hypothetical protein